MPGSCPVAAPGLRQAIMILWIEDIARVTMNDVEEFTGGI